MCQFMDTLSWSSLCQGIRSELSCRNHACRTTAEQRQLSLLASSRFQANQSGIICHKLQKRQTLAPNSETKFDPKNEAILASPNETIEAVSQKLKLKTASVERDTNCPKRKKCHGAKKKDLPMNVPANSSTDARTTGVCQHKVPFFNQQSTRLSSCVIMPESKIIHRFFL